MQMCMPSIEQAGESAAELDILQSTFLNNRQNQTCML